MVAGSGGEAHLCRSCGGGGEFVARLDQDGDGYVSAEKFDGAAEHFSLFDTNGAGYLSEAEAPPPVRLRVC